MKHNKELNGCISRLREMQLGSDIRPEQFEDIEKAIRLIKGLWRIKNPKHAQVFSVVRQVTDRLLKAFLKK
jgi:hypothetical protein